MYYGCYCGAGFELLLKSKMVSVDGVEQFCSAACLLKFLKETGNSDRLLDIIAKTNPVPHSLGVGAGAYDAETDTWFRSGYEIIVSKFFDYHKIKWTYEARSVPFKGRGFYVPDFLLQAHGYLVEVKGRWTGKGKRKFIETAKQLPVILIQDYLVKDIKRYAIHTS